MDVIFMIITLLLLAAIAVAAWLLVYWVLHDPLPRADKVHRHRPPTAGKARKRRPRLHH